MRLASDERINAGLDAYPILRSYFEADVDFARRACRGWGGEPDPSDDEPVESDIPVLILAGQFDPVTPPTWGKAVAERLENSAFVEFPGQGHGVTLDTPCAFEIMDLFLTSPYAKPDLSCVSEMEVEFE
jgi:pimeloyl-ACP methyl ester carboxylesterase